MGKFKSAAQKVYEDVKSLRLAGTDRDAEWQRVNSYIADVLKDSHVLYAKLARLQGDFGGEELMNLEKISEYVLEIGGKLSSFSKAFYEGRADISTDEQFGEQEQSQVKRPSVNLESLGKEADSYEEEEPSPKFDISEESDDSDESDESDESEDESSEPSSPEVEFDYSEEDSDEEDSDEEDSED